jgi:hypothetical protein
MTDMGNMAWASNARTSVSADASATCGADEDECLDFAKTVIISEPWNLVPFVNEPVTVAKTYFPKFIVPRAAFPICSC